METYLTIEELGQYLKVAEQSIRRWVLNREIPFCKIKKVIRFRLSEIEKWVDNKGAVAAVGETQETTGQKENGVLFADTETEARGEV